MNPEIKVCVELLKEIEFRTEVLGEDPREHIEPIATFIETTAAENHDKLDWTIDEIVSMFEGDKSAYLLFRRLMDNQANNINGVGVRLFTSENVREWLEKNHDFMVQRILRPNS